MVSGPVPGPGRAVQGPTRLRLQQEVTATNVQHGLVSHATTQPFLTFLLCFYTPCQEARAALLALPLAGAQLVTLVLLQARGRGSHDSLGSATSSLPHLALHFFSLWPVLEEARKLEACQVLGRPQSTTHCWLLTNLCAWATAASPDHFLLLEAALLDLLLGHSPAGGLLASDIWCFIAR